MPWYQSVLHCITSESPKGVKACDVCNAFGTEINEMISPDIDTLLRDKYGISSVYLFNCIQPVALFYFEQSDYEAVCPL
jgi:hypothetical protein